MKMMRRDLLRALKGLTERNRKRKVVTMAVRKAMVTKKLKLRSHKVQRKREDGAKVQLNPAARQVTRRRGGGRVVTSRTTMPFSRIMGVIRNSWRSSRPPS